MTSIDMPVAAAHTAAPTADVSAAAVAERRLRLVLTANAATSLAAGVVGLAATRWVADLLGLAGTGWARLVSAALVVFALDVLWVSRARTERLRAGAAVVSALDAAWVAGTVALVALGAFDGVGTAVALAMGVGVGDFAALQLLYRRRSACPRSSAHPPPPAAAGGGPRVYGARLLGEGLAKALADRHGGGRAAIGGFRCRTR